MPRPNWRVSLALIGAAVLLVAAAQAGTAVTPTAVPASGVINACYQKEEGMLRLINEGQSCRTSEVPVAWNIQGFQGIQGIQGIRGPQGIPGIVGLEGKSCPAGTAVTGFSATGELECGRTTPLCQPTTLTYFAIATWYGDENQLWPGGTVRLGDDTCNVVVKIPSGSILDIGDLGDRWEILSKTGYGSATLTVDTPHCNSVAAIPNVTLNRPSCSSASSFADVARSSTGISVAVS